MHAWWIWGWWYREENGKIGERDVDGWIVVMMFGDG